MKRPHTVLLPSARFCYLPCVRRISGAAAYCWAPGGSTVGAGAASLIAQSVQRVLDVYPKTVWLNPQPEERWGYYESIGMVRQLVGDRMYPLTLGGLEEGMRELSR